MKYQMPDKCPVCNGMLNITHLKCSHCESSLSGSFTPDTFSYLSSEHKTFIEVFVMKRGNIKEVEKELGVSYPTVRKLLDEVIENLMNLNSGSKSADKEIHRFKFVMKMDFNGKNVYNLKMPVELAKHYIKNDMIFMDFEDDLPDDRIHFIKSEEYRDFLEKNKGKLKFLKQIKSQDLMKLFENPVAMTLIDLYNEKDNTYVYMGIEKFEV